MQLLPTSPDGNTAGVRTRPVAWPMRAAFRTSKPARRTVPPPIAMDNPEGFRHRMVEIQIVARGVSDPGVLAAMREVPREQFVPPASRQSAYDDAPLGIGAGQTISQPYIVALMIEAARVRPGARVLEIGTGSGYAAAVLSRIAAHVVTVERWPELAARARQTLRDLGYANVDVHHADGMAGWAPDAPYDAILAAAAGTEVPPAWLDQLAPGGTLVLPMGRIGHVQRLLRITKAADGSLTREDLGGVAFVPLVPDVVAPAPSNTGEPPSGSTPPQRETR